MGKGILNSRKQRKIKEPKGVHIAKIVMSVLLVVYSVTLVFPFLNLLVISFTGVDEYLEAGSVFFYFPKIFTFENYGKAWSILEYDDMSLLTMLFNSVWWAAGGAFLHIATAAFLGYAVAKYKFFGRKVIHAVSLFTMLLPIYGSMPASYVVYTDMGIYNNPLILITCCAGFGGTFILTYAFFKSLPRSYMEAAYIDGAGHFIVFFKIMLPLAIVPLSALFIQEIMTRWNDYMTPILYFPDYITIPAGLYTFQVSEMRGYETPVLYAGLTLCMIPPLVLYGFLNNKLMSLTIAGGLKG